MWDTPLDAILRNLGVHALRFASVNADTGAGTRYCLTVKTPDEDFAALIRRGVPATLSVRDKAVLGRP